MKRIKLALFVCLLAGIITASFVLMNVKNGVYVVSSTASPSGNILYVGGTGPNNYTNIQDAINNASNGDTVFVYDGIYYENIAMGKRTVTLQGESQGGTIIDGNGNGDAVIVTASSVYINMFTIRNGGMVSKGIHLYHAHLCSITQCTIERNGVGIMMDCSDNSVITYCTFRHNQIYGAQTHGCSPKNNVIHHNNFIENNGANAFDKFTNSWDDGSEGNYWDDYSGSDENKDGIGDTPYAILGGTNKDRYPLMEALDNTPPITSYTLSGNMGNEGWYISNVEITLTAADFATGVKEIKYKVDGGNWIVYTSPVTLNTDGVHTLYYYSIDKYGNEEGIHSCTIKVDKTNPIVGIIKPQSHLYLFDRAIIPTVTPIVIGKITIEIDASDAFSGIKQVKLFIGENLKEIFDNEPYAWVWNEKIIGKHTIKAIAYDIASNRASSEQFVWIFNL